MKRLTITVLVAGLFAGSLFASENNTMMGMDKEKCMAMHKSMHENSTNNQLEKEPSVIKKYEELLNSKNSRPLNIPCQSNSDLSTLGVLEISCQSDKIQILRVENARRKTNRF